MKRITIFNFNCFDTKKTVLFIAILFSVTVTSLKAQTQTQAQPSGTTTPVKPKSDRNDFVVDVGMSFFFLSTNFNTEFLGGFAINGGYFISDHSLLELEFSFLFGGGDEIGSFSYYYNNRPGRIYYDGKITRDYTAIPVLMSWNYIFDCTQIFHIRMGPSIGLISLNASNSYSPSNIEGLPGSFSQNETLFAFGAGIGASWDVLKRSCITLGYKFIINSGGSLDGMDINPIANQINVTWGWRF